MDFHTESKQRCLELIDRYFDLVTFPEFMPDQLTELKKVYFDINEILLLICHLGMPVHGWMGELLNVDDNA